MYFSRVHFQIKKINEIAGSFFISEFDMNFFSFAFQKEYHFFSLFHEKLKWRKITQHMGVKIFFIQNGISNKLLIP